MDFVRDSLTKPIPIKVWWPFPHCLTDPLMLVAAVRAVLEFHCLHRHYYKRPHHSFILVIENVAVIHKATGCAAELAGNAHQLAAICPDDVLPALLVLVNRCGGANRDRLSGYGAALDRT